MKQFIKRSLLFVFPLVLWALVVLVIDPFNYWNISNVVDLKHKEMNAQRLNTLMYRTIDYMNSPSENMLIGDSRTNALPVDLIESISGLKYKKLNTNAAKLNEIFDLIYLTNERQKLKNVVVGINFNMFNEFGYADRVSGVKRILENPLLYIYNKDVAEVCYYTVRSLLTEESVSFAPPMSKEEFWKWSIETKAAHWYGRYKFPTELHADLVKLDKFTKENEIHLMFIIVPHHVEFSNRLVEFNLKNSEKQFKDILSGLNARVIDYDFQNSITLNKNNFTDPVHYNHDIGNLIVSEIWNNNVSIGKEL